jgi:2-polyprenyl-3-methyl-5-hydroxy-6-metoxy-1,4-benzoquinol methylase
MEEIDLDFYYRHYPLQRHKLDLWARVAYKNRLSRLIKEGLKQDHDILDFGCGVGLFISYLHEKGYKKAVGYDANVADFAKEKVLSETYDVITTQDVIEHIDEPRRVIAQLSRILRPGGFLCIGTPNAEEISLSDPEKYLLSLHQPYHRHILSEIALIDLCEKEGLKCDRIYNRWYYDTLFPTVNYRFLSSYIRQNENVLDTAFEEPNVTMVLKSPELLFFSIFGYFFPIKTEMMVFFKKLQ